jgi:hypothetical protein
MPDERAGAIKVDDKLAKLGRHSPDESLVKTE